MSVTVYMKNASSDPTCVFLLWDLLNNSLGTRLERITVDLTAPVILSHGLGALFVRVTRQWKPAEGNHFRFGTCIIRD